MHRQEGQEGKEARPAFVFVSHREATARWLREKAMGCVHSIAQEGDGSPVDKEPRRRSTSAASAEVLELQSSKGKIRPNGNIPVVEDAVDDSRKDRLVTPPEGRGMPSPSPRAGQVVKTTEGEQVAAGWPAWLAAVAGEAIKGWVPRRADSFEKLDKVCMGRVLNGCVILDEEVAKVLCPSCCWPRQGDLVG